MDKLRGIVAKIFVFVLFGLLILSFAVWGIGDMLRQSGEAPAVAEVGDQRIEEQTFRRELSETMTLLSRRIGDQVDLEMAQALGLPQQVLQRLVTDTLITAEAETRGLLVTDQQVVAAIQANPAFADATGRFDRGRFEQTLFQARVSEAAYVEDLRDQLLQQQLSSALGAAIEPPELLVEALYRRQGELRRADWVELAVAAQPEVPLPADSELEDYYEANSQAFMAPAYRSLTYLWLQPEDLFEEVAVQEAAVRAEYEDNLGAYVEPERRTVRQAVYGEEAEARAAYERVQGGEDYAAVVEETTGGAPVPLGTVPEAGLPPALREAAFGSETPGVVEPVESPFGWHLVLVEDIQAGEEVAFEEIRPEIERRLKRAEAVDSLISLVNQLDDELAAGATLEEAADRLDLALTEVEAIDRQGTDPEGRAVNPLPQPDRFLREAFETPVGEQSLVLETEQGGYFLVRVEGETPAAPRAFEAVRDRVAELWQREQQQAAAWERADALQQRLNEGQSLAKVAEDEGLTVVEGEPVRRDAREPSQALVEALFEVEPGASVTAEGPEGPLLAVLRDVEAPDPAADTDAVASVREELTQGVRGDLFNLYLQALEQRHGVRLYQDRIDQVLAAF